MAETNLESRIDRYESGESILDIADADGVSKQAVHIYLVKNGVEMRGPSGRGLLQNTIAEKIYDLRARNKTPWGDMPRLTGMSNPESRSAEQMARNFANCRGLPWPPRKPAKRKQKRR